MSRGPGIKKVFFMRCIDEECGHLHSIKIQKKRTTSINGHLCPSCYQRLSYYDVHNLSWVNTEYQYGGYCQEIIDEDAIAAGIAWANS